MRSCIVHTHVVKKIIELLLEYLAAPIERPSKMYIGFSLFEAAISKFLLSFIFQHGVTLKFISIVLVISEDIFVCVSPHISSFTEDKLSYLFFESEEI